MILDLRFQILDFRFGFGCGGRLAAVIAVDRADQPYCLGRGLMILDFRL